MTPHRGGAGARRLAAPTRSGGRRRLLSGAGHDGVFAEGTPLWVEGVFGMALSFDGDNKVEVPDHADASRVLRQLEMMVAGSENAQGV